MRDQHEILYPHNFNRLGEKNFTLPLNMTPVEVGSIHRQEVSEQKVITIFPGDILQVHASLPARREVPIEVSGQLRGLLKDDNIWNGLLNQRSNDPDQQFDNYPTEYIKAFPVVQALRQSGATVTEVFAIALDCANNSKRRTSDESMRFNDAKDVTIQLKKFTDRHLFETVELENGQLEGIIDNFYNRVIRPKGRAKEVAA